MTLTELEFIVEGLEEPVIPCEFGEYPCDQRAEWAFIYSACDKCGDTGLFIFCTTHKDEMLDCAGRTNKKFACFNLKCQGKSTLIRIEKV